MLIWGFSYIVGFIVFLSILIIGTVDFRGDKTGVVIAILDSLVLALIWPVAIVALIIMEIRN